MSVEHLWHYPNILFCFVHLQHITTKIHECNQCSTIYLHWDQKCLQRTTINDVDGGSTRRQVMNCKGTVEVRSGSPEQAAALLPNKSVLIVSTSARPGINRHSAYQHSYQHAANQEPCTCTCTSLSIFNVVIKVAQSCVAVNICNTQGSRTHSHHPPIVWLSVWLYLSGLLPGSPH